jgi:hypothetical protein
MLGCRGLVVARSECIALLKRRGCEALTQGKGFWWRAQTRAQIIKNRSWVPKMVQRNELSDRRRDPNEKPTTGGILQAGGRSSSTGYSS